MNTLIGMAIRVETAGEETYVEVKRGRFREACVYLHSQRNAALRLMFATDEREIDGMFKVYAVFTIPRQEGFIVISLPVSQYEPEFPSITMDIPAAHWYEREIQDMFGLEAQGHPDPRRLVLHESFPKGQHPLRRDWVGDPDELAAWGEGKVEHVPYNFMKVGGEGIFEVPVGPVHAGIIEPGHFRFSVVGESIFFLEPRLFYTHKGTEKHFESIGFHAGVRLAERVSGTSSVAHGVAFCLAVERMMGMEVPQRARAARTLLLELERIYNHLGDIGNMCAGTAFAVGYHKGAVIKEHLLRMNQLVTGSRFLRDVNILGGVSRDPFIHKDAILQGLEQARKGHRELMGLVLGSVSHVERLQNIGVLSKDIARRLGATGIAAKGSGIDEDLRSTHPHLLYSALTFEPRTSGMGDAYGRMMVRSEEVECSMSMVEQLLDMEFEGPLSVEPQRIPRAHARGLGYCESPRGAVFYWVKSASDGTPLRVKMRSPSFCNWPVVPYAVHGNIVPDFPLCNKSFNLSYSGCDM